MSSDPGIQRNAWGHDPAQLNPDQERIVAHLEGPALVIAGAGSGKTRKHPNRATVRPRAMRR